MTEDSFSHQFWATDSREIQLDTSGKYLCTRKKHKTTGHANTTHEYWIVWTAPLKLFDLFQKKAKKCVLLEFLKNSGCWSPDLLHHLSDHGDTFSSTTVLWDHEKSTSFLEVIGGKMVADLSTITHFN